MELIKTELQGVVSIKLESFQDHRGYYLETYNKKMFNDLGIKLDFVQDDISVSKKNVLRGIHGDNVTWKLISCFYGEFYFVVVNCDKDSKDFGKWQSFILSESNKLQVLVPPKFGNAYLVLSEKTIFSYKQTTYYDPKKQFTYKWNDPIFNISWPINNPVLSRRDEIGDFSS